MARRSGLMALENQDVPDPFFSKGLQLLVDGADEAKMSKQLNQEIKAMKTRHAEIHDAIKGWIDIAPAMGMIGTLIGLVQMLGNMADPKAIGPAMAVALLTTLYGAFLANVIFGPILAKLEGYSAVEAQYRDMVVAGLRNIARGESGRNVQEQMGCRLASQATKQADGGLRKSRWPVLRSQFQSQSKRSKRMIALNVLQWELLPGWLPLPDIATLLMAFLC